MNKLLVAMFAMRPLGLPKIVDSTWGVDGSMVMITSQVPATSAIDFAVDAPQSCALYKKTKIIYLYHTHQK
jgi:hypothetical protein